jgi:anionic cell wall polymer biosynthesis LytR-Cps2A-Psr (LCP) family protein
LFKNTPKSYIVDEVFMTSKHSIDGFVPRRPGNQLGDAHAVGEKSTQPTSGLRRSTASRTPIQPAVSQKTNLGIVRADISDSLKGIDTTIEDPGKGKKGRKKRGPKSKKRRIITWIIIVLVLIVLVIGGWIAYKTFTATGSIFKGNIFDIVQSQPLKQDANGRSNILVVGTSQDDPGHDAGYLTDSMMVVSVDQKNKNAYMISIPRDLEVKYGQACMSGYQGKINAYFNCVGGGTGDVEADRTALTKEAGFVGEILGLEIQYGVNVNYTVMRELVGAIGGITVNIEGSGGAPGVMDSNFDWKCGLGDPKVSRAERLRRCPPNGHFIEYPNGPVELDAEHALYLAQARGDTAPTYGLGRSNFDREINQQKIVKAIREKAMSAGVLTNPGRVSGVIDALGNNLRTTFEANEVRTLVSLAQEIKDKDIQSISLIDEANPILNGNAQPVEGKFMFGALRAYIQKKLSSNPVVREEAGVVVLNGSGVPGVAQTEADKLAAIGFMIAAVDTAPEAAYADVEVYQIGDGKAATKAKLESLFSVKVKTTPPPVAVAEGTHFVVIFGKDRSANN